MSVEELGVHHNVVFVVGVLPVVVLHQAENDALHHALGYGWTVA